VTARLNVPFSLPPPLPPLHAANASAIATVTAGNVICMEFSCAYLGTHGAMQPRVPVVERAEPFDRNGRVGF
jgi:hypothetical protein